MVVISLPIKRRGTAVLHSGDKHVLWSATDGLQLHFANWRDIRGDISQQLQAARGDGTALWRLGAAIRAKKLGIATNP
jgi:hypothetical protein